MIDLQVGTGLREETAAVLAGAVCHLLAAGRCAELRCRPADVIDIALEIGLLQHLPGLLQDGFMAADLHDTAFMESEGAEIAVPVAAAVGCETEADLSKGRNAARLVVHGMPGAHIGKCVNIIHLPHGEGFGGRILHDKSLSAVGLVEPLCLKRVGVCMLQGEALCIGALTLFVRLTDKLMVRQADGVEDVFFISRLVHGAVNIGDVAHIHAAGQGIRDLHDAALTHSVGDQVCACLQKDRAAHAVRPVVIVGHAPQACLESAQDKRRLFKGPADQVAVDHHGVVGALSHLAARAEGIAASMLFVDRVVVDHGIHISGGYQKAKTRLTQGSNALGLAPVRLADHSHRISSGLQDTRNNGRPEARVVHIRISADIYKIQLFNPLGLHVLPAHGQKAPCH